MTPRIRSLSARVLFPLASLAIAACTGTSAGPESTVRGDDGGDAGVTPDAGPGPGPTEAGVDARPATVAGTYRHTLSVDGQARRFIVYVPPSVRPAAPVVFMLHGTSQDGQHFYDESTWRAQADAAGHLVVFPDSLTYCFYEDDDRDGVFAPSERRVTTKWTHGTLGKPDGLPLCTPEEIAGLAPAVRVKADHPLVDDVAFIDALLAFVTRTYDVNAKRFYATGFSNGASFTERLLVERSTSFAAFAANSGALNVDPVPGTRAASLTFTIGNQDAHIFPPSALPLPLTEALVAQPEFGSRFVKPLLTTMQLEDRYTFSDQSAGGTRILRWRYQTSSRAASNVLDVQVVQGLAHVYPDAMPAALWEQFKEQSLP